MLAPLPNLSSCLRVANNLSDLASAATARTNLGLGTAAVAAVNDFDAAGSAADAISLSLQKASNLSDLASNSTARTNLGLGSLAVLSSVSLTANVTGTLPAANGGTGLSALGSALQVLRTNAGATAAEWATLTVPTGADPTGTIGLTAANGSASTFLRSDGAPALSQSISPTWTGLHTFSAAAGTVKTRVTAGAAETVNLSEWALSNGTTVGTRVTKGAGLEVWLQADTEQFGVKSPSGTNYFSVGYYGGITFGAGSVTINSPFDCGSTGMNIIRTTSGNNLTAVGGVFRVVTGAAGNTGWQVAGAASQTAPLVQLLGTSSTSTVREQANVDAAWADSTDASRKARLVLSAWDTAAREILRGESDGSRGYLIQSAPSTAPGDAMLPNSSVCFYDNGSGSLLIKLKDSGGTVRTGTVTLT